MQWDPRFKKSTVWLRNATGCAYVHLCQTLSSCVYFIPKTGLFMVWEG